MPRISSFFGIVVYMYYDDHEPAHFHVLYEGEEAMFGFNGSLLRGFISERGRKLVEEWALLHTKG